MCSKKNIGGLKMECETETKNKFKAGVFQLSEYELEMLAPEFMEIHNIISLAKVDTGVKNILLTEVLREFWSELQQQFYDYFGSQGIIRE